MDDWENSSLMVYIPPFSGQSQKLLYKRKKYFVVKTLSTGMY